MKSKQLTEKVSITGYVRATEWDWQDDVSGISIEAHDDEEYVIDSNGLEEFLFREVDREVELMGIVEQNEDGAKHISVTSYKPLSESDVQEEDDYEFEEDYDLKIDAALDRIDSKTYGYCEETGEEIGIKRLEARLTATLCLEAQHWLERGKDYERSIFQ